MRQAFAVVEQNLVSLVDHHVVILAHLARKLAVRIVHNELEIDTESRSCKLEHILVGALQRARGEHDREELRVGVEVLQSNRGNNDSALAHA